MQEPLHGMAKGTLIEKKFGGNKHAIDKHENRPISFDCPLPAKIDRKKVKKTE